MQIVYSPQVIQLAKKYGVDLPAAIDVPAQAAVLDLAQELSPGADFGAPFGLKKIAAKVMSSARIAAAGGNRPAVKNGVTLAFGINNPNAPLSQAFASADRLLGDPKIPNAQAIVRNTQALAALGDTAAKRGMIALTTVDAIRKKTATPIGKSVIKAAPLPARAVTVQRNKTQVKKMAAKVQPKKKGVFARIVAWFKAL